MQMTTDQDAYAAFLAEKAIVDPPTGLPSPGPVSPLLFPYQRDIVRWALRRGRAAIFADCGLGKTAMQLEWACQIPGRVLILTPLAVAPQTVREGEKFGVPAYYARNQADADALGSQIIVTNYEMLDRFDPSQFAGVVLDESSILKAFDGSTRQRITDAFRDTPYRLACTATPAPNDFMELGNHSEFLGVMNRAEMLATFFVHDGGETQKWRLKGHAETEFWRWLCGWAVNLRRPSDIGHDDAGFTLPPLTIAPFVVPTAPDAPLAQTLSERLRARRATVDARVAACASLVNETPGTWVIWCNLNDESAALVAAIPGAVEVRGSMPVAQKEQALNDFSAGKIRVLVTKPSIAGFGMNWQHCHQMAFVGLSDSWEQYYQAVRRCWRFGQTQPVTAYIISADVEGAVVANITRKEQDAKTMADQMAAHMSDLNTAAVTGVVREKATYERDVAVGDGWTLHLGDCVDAARELATDSLDYSIFSPPFASLYTYSNSDRDMGNAANDAEFFTHFGFLVRELYRALKPGRLVSFHCMDLPMSKMRDGVIGLRDFRGDLIRLFQAHGFVLHSQVTIWKDPVTAMQRTKALGLLHKTIRTDSSRSRMGVPDYLVTMRKPGDNPDPIAHTADEFPVPLWQRYASPVWFDIRASDTLQYRSAREDQDEKHICPLQLDVIRRGVTLWSNPGDVVFSPFAGIGSEGYVARELGRRFLGVELKRSYWEQAARNLAAVTPLPASASLPYYGDATDDAPTMNELLKAYRAQQAAATAAA